MISRKFILPMIVLIFLTMTFTPGCSSKSKDSQAKKPSASSQQKPPPELKSILGDIENIITGLAKQISNDKKPAQQMQMSQSQSDQKQSGQSKSDQSGQSQSQQNQSSNQANQGQSGNSSKPQEDPWKEMTSALKNIHKSWNKLEPEAIKAGLGVADRNNFEKAIDNLTLQINQKNKMDSLKAAIELYGQYANLVKVFKSTVPADLYKTKYEIMAASVEAANGEWEIAAQRMTKLKDYWKSTKVQAKIKDEKIISQSEFSLDDFEAAVSSKNIDLLIIKAEIALGNLQQIEKGMSKPTQE